MTPLFSVRGLGHERNGSTLFSSVAFDVSKGDVTFITGPSGCGKSTLLRTLALLEPVATGSILLRGRAPWTYGVPNWRAKVCYISQTQVTLNGSPRDLFLKASRFRAQTTAKEEETRGWSNVVELAWKMGLEEGVLEQKWTEMSGGQAQRSILAVGIGLCPEILLLDEVTNACDEASQKKVEEVVKGSGCGVVWVSHSKMQVGRVGGTVLEFAKNPMGKGDVLVDIARIASFRET